MITSSSYTCRSKDQVQQFSSVTQFQAMFNFSVEQFKSAHIEILSVFNETILISDGFYFVTYTLNGNYLSNIPIKIKIPIEAIWTPRGNIVYTTTANNAVVRILVSGTVTARTKMSFPMGLSVSDDNIIYLADMETGIHQSMDDGASWSNIFNPNDGRQSLKVFKLSGKNNSEEYWTLEADENFNRQLRVYSLNKGHSKGNVTWMNIVINTVPSLQKNFSDFTVFHINGVNIILAGGENKAVHFFLMNGQYHCQLTSPVIENEPTAITVGNKNRLLVVGQHHGTLAVFKLIYGENVPL